jgi:hypothetical protein
MPDNGTYILSNVGFSSNEKPTLLLQKDESFLEFTPLGHSFTLSFDINQRHCTGWRDITDGSRFACPDNQLVDAKYEQCPKCQQRTGFNPAFYHATSISPQQEARNNEPHLLYLAHFGSGLIKVGISHAKRERARLLEQGARSAVILDQFPSAHIARQYEAKIAALAGFAETVQLRKKLDLIAQLYNPQTAATELSTAITAIESELGIAFNKSEFISLDAIYFPNQIPELSHTFNTAKQNLISGICIGQLGSILFCSQDDKIFYLPLKKYIGYLVKFTDTLTAIETPARQTSLF